MPGKLTLQSSIRLSSGWNVPVLGLGVYKNSDCIPACLAALKAGYRHIDTAEMYANEKQVGEAVRESAFKRQDLFITTKLQTKNRSYEAALSQIDRSLATLGFDYVDLFLIHEPLSGAKTRIEVWRALLEAKRQGKIRTIGVSNFAVKHLEELKNAGLEHPAFNQVELHPFCQQQPIVEYCTKHGIVVGAYAPLRRAQFDDPVLQNIAKKHSKEPAHIMIRWSLQRGFVPVPKSSHPARIVSNADVFNFELDEEDMRRLNALDMGKDGAVTWNPIDAD